MICSPRATTKLAGPSLHAEAEGMLLRSLCLTYQKWNTYILVIEMFFSFLVYLSFISITITISNNPTMRHVRNLLLAVMVMRLMVVSQMNKC